MDIRDVGNLFEQRRSIRGYDEGKDVSTRWFGRSLDCAR